MLIRTNDMFRKQFAVPQVSKLEDVGAFFSNRSGVYEVEPRAKVLRDAARLSMASMEDMVMIWSKWNTPAQSIAQTSRNKLCINVLLNGSTDTLHPDAGRVVTRKNTARVTMMKEGTKIANAANKQTLELALPFDQLEMRARKYYDDDKDQHLQFDPMADLSSPNGRALLNIFSFIQSSFLEYPQPAFNPIIVANMKELVFTSILGLLPNSFQQDPPNQLKFTMPRVVARAE